mmetsp:Transcript_134569/g.287931  ORF Transcript_134569/g.287931 Transcript_134569/m.287931 type:complete len:207 (-) Transcript_134569:188-808(-)
MSASSLVICMLHWLTQVWSLPARVRKSASALSAPSISSSSSPFFGSLKSNLHAARLTASTFHLGEKSAACWSRDTVKRLPAPGAFTAVFGDSIIIPGVASLRSCFDGPECTSTVISLPAPPRRDRAPALPWVVEVPAASLFPTVLLLLSNTWLDPSSAWSMSVLRPPLLCFPSEWPADSGSCSLTSIFFFHCRFKTAIMGSSTSSL